jgi:hypothetical protein
MIIIERFERGAPRATDQARQASAQDRHLMILVSRSSSFTTGHFCRGCSAEHVAARTNTMPALQTTRRSTNSPVFQVGTRSLPTNDLRYVACRSYAATVKRCKRSDDHPKGTGGGARASGAARMHGGARGSGGPQGNRNGNFKHGIWTMRRAVRAQIREIRALLRATELGTK